MTFCYRIGPEMIWQIKHGRLTETIKSACPPVLSPVSCSFMMKHIATSCVFLLIFMSAGCGRDGKQNPVYSVKGQVRFAGKPMVGGGAIAFIPTGNQTGKTAGGAIDKDGNYILSTYTEGDGSIAGEFRVVITQEVVREPDPVPDGSGNVAEPVMTVTTAERIPMIYSDYNRSPLTARVEARSANKLDFELSAAR